MIESALAGLGVLVLAVIAYAIGWHEAYCAAHGEGWRDGWGHGYEARKADEALVRKVADLTEPLLCPVCKAPRSNAEISNGWCANCGVYSDGTP